jgi:hypothetical protein
MGVDVSPGRVFKKVRWGLAIVLPAVAVFVALYAMVGPESSKHHEPASVVVSSTNDPCASDPYQTGCALYVAPRTTTDPCLADPYQYGCPLYVAPTTTTLDQAVYYQRQMSTCESEVYPTVAYESRPEFQRALGRDATLAEIQQMTEQQCAQQLQSRGIYP